MFYNKIDPVWYQAHWDFNGNGTVDRFRRVIGKYEFANVNFERDSRNSGTLLIAAPDEVPQNVNTISVIKFPDGRIAYKIISI